MTIFEKNIQTLQARYPSMATSVREIHISIQSPETKPSQNVGFPHAKKNAPAIAIGVGDGRFILDIMHHQNPSLLVVIEPDIRHFARVLALKDLSALLSHSAAHWIIGAPLQNIERHLFHIKSQLAAHGFQIMPEPASYPPHSNAAQSISRTLQAIIQKETVHLRARLARATLTQTNILKNLPHILGAAPPDAVANLAENTPAYIVAAGPSLDKNVSALSLVGDSGLIICVDTAVRALLENQIQPHAVVTTDPTPENARHFDGIKLRKNTLFAFAPDVFFGIPKQFARLPNRVCLHDASTRLSYRLQEILGFERIVERSLNVAEAAIRLALLLGCRPIIFAGLDLAFPAGSRTTHAASAAHSLAIKNPSTHSATLEDADGNSSQVELCEVKGWNGESLRTYHSFKLYLEELETITQSHPNQWHDATEGGARKKGCRPVRLREAIERFQVQAQRPAFEGVEGSLSKKQFAQLKRDGKHIKALLGDLQSLDQEQCPKKTLARWKRFLDDPIARSYLDHAVFRFQLMEPLDGFEDQADGFEGQALRELAQSRALDAAKTIQPLIELFEKSLSTIKL